MSGFENIIENNVLASSSPSALSSLCQKQDTILTSDRFSNEADLIPTVQEETLSLNKIIVTVTGIKEHLDGCCDEIKLLLRDLKQQIRDFEKSLKEMLNLGIDSVRYDIKATYNSLETFYNSELSKFEAFLNSLKSEIYNEIRNIIIQENQVLSDKIVVLKSELINTIRQESEVISDKIAASERELRNVILYENQVILNKIASLERQLQAVNNNITSVHTTISNVEQALESFVLDWGNYKTTYNSNHNKIVLNIAASTTEINGALTTSSRITNSSVLLVLNKTSFTTSNKPNKQKNRRTK